MCKNVALWSFPDIAFGVTAASTYATQSTFVFPYHDAASNTTTNYNIVLRIANINAHFSRILLLKMQK